MCAWFVEGRQSVLKPVLPVSCLLNPLKMGSDDKAVITGFICRLCSRMNRFVVHIYGDEGVQMQLAQKINVYLPITVNPNDPLPKTVCISCIDSLEAQHELMEQFKWARRRVQSAAKSQTTQDCGRHHSPRPPDDVRTQSVIVSPSDINRSSRHADSPRPQNQSAHSASSTSNNYDSSTAEPPWILDH